MNIMVEEEYFLVYTVFICELVAANRSNYCEGTECVVWYMILC